MWQDMTTRITETAVRKAIERGNTLSPEIIYSCRPDVLPGRISVRQFHVRRVAHFVVNDWTDAISIDVGVPDLGCHVDWIVIDGNHRLAAAFYRGDETIEGNVSGDLDRASQMFGLSEDALTLD